MRYAKFTWFLGTAGLLLTVTGAAHGAPPQWTILREVCWKISQTAGQCAVGLAGTFATRDDCIAANGGQLETKGSDKGVTHAARCEILLQQQ